MKKILAVYEISYCPLYSAIPNTETQHQQQEALWTTAKWFAINNHQTSIELCLISEPTSFTVRPFVLLYAPNTPTTDTQENELLNSFERILPDDYGWKRFYNIKNNQEFDDRQTFLKKVFENFDSYQWYSTSLKRRFEVFDISPKLLQSDTFWGTRPNTTISTDNTPTENETTPSTEFPLPTEPFYTNESQKQFPDTNPYAVKAQLLFSPISLPFHPAIQDTFCQRSFFQELLYSAPAIISTRLSPSRLDELFDRIHSLASFARRILEPYHWLINPDNTIPYSEVERFYSGFIGTQHNLSKFSIKVTTSDFSKTQSLALALITPLGGSRAFELSSPVCGFSTRIPIEEQAEQTRQYFQNLRINTSDEIFSQWEEGLVLLTPNIINQREADILLRLPIGDEQGLPGMEVRQPPPFATSTKNLSKENTNQTGYIQLGQIKTSKVNDKNNPNALYHSIKLKDLCKHALIVGSTGSGKTTTVQYLLKQIAQAKIPFLVIEPSMKAEYFEKLKDHIPHLKRVKVDDLCFDPMWIPKGKDKKDKDKDITAVQHISYLKSCFQAAFPINEYGIAHLETCLIKYYKYVQDKYLFLNQPENITYLARVNTGKKDEKNNDITEFKIVNSKVENALPIPSFDNFTSCVQPILTESFPKGYREKDPNNWIDTLQRKFDNLKLGQLGQIFKRAEEKKRKDPEWTFAKEYLTTPTIIELNTIPDREQQALLMAFILTFIFETRQTEGVVKDNNEKLPRHVLVIEEAHRLLGRNTGNRHSEISGESASGKAATMFSDMLAEVRAFGQSVFIAEQIPSKIIPDAVKNTNLKFLMRLTSAEDRRFMGEAMNCSELQQQFVNTLKAGQAVVFEEGLNQPILLTIPNIFTK